MMRVWRYPLTNSIDPDDPDLTVVLQPRPSDGCKKVSYLLLQPLHQAIRGGRSNTPPLLTGWCFCRWNGGCRPSARGLRTDLQLGVTGGWI